MGKGIYDSCTLASYHKSTILFYTLVSMTLKKTNEEYKKNNYTSEHGGQSPSQHRRLQA